VGVPKKRRSYTRRHLKRAHHALGKISLVTCTNCGEPTLPHRVCPHCNHYKGKLAFPVED
jgi:large subunit ribosomal protein L32